jgi:chromosome segregation ATPase
MTIDLEELAEWRAETDAHLARLDLVAEEHEQDLQAKRGADNRTLSAIRETQLDHGKKFDAIEGKIDLLGRGQEALQAGQKALQAGQRTLKAGQEALQGDMTTVKDRLDKMDDRLAKVDEKLDLLLNK